jgi:hypothetical protein
VDGEKTAILEPRHPVGPFRPQAHAAIDDEEIRTAVVAVHRLLVVEVDERVTADIEVVAVAPPVQDRGDEQHHAVAVPGRIHRLTVRFHEREVLDLLEQFVDPWMCRGGHEVFSHLVYVSR